MATYVLTTGLNLPTVVELIDRMASEEKAAINPLLNTSPDGVIGQLNGIFAAHLGEAYEVADVAYHAFDRAAAEGDALDILGALTGTPREDATYARFVGTKRVTVNLEAGTTLPIGSIANIAGRPTEQWETTESVTNTGGSPADLLVSMIATEPGPKNAPIGTLTEIPTPVPGWNSVNNTTLPVPGKNRETDGDYRRRQESELRARGSGTLQSMRADFLALEVDGENVVLTCRVFENDNDTTDIVTNLPPHSFEVLFDDGVGLLLPDETAAQTIWDNKPMGIQTYGLVTANATDEFGAAQPMSFSRVTYRAHTVTAALIVDPTTYTGTTAGKDLVIAASMTQQPGKRVRWSLYAEILKLQPGVVAVESVTLRWVGGPVVAAFTDLVPGRYDRPYVVDAAAVTITTTNEASET